MESIWYWHGKGVNISTYFVYPELTYTHLKQGESTIWRECSTSMAAPVLALQLYFTIISIHIYSYPTTK